MSVPTKKLICKLFQKRENHLTPGCSNRTFPKNSESPDICLLLHIQKVENVSLKGLMGCFVNIRPDWTFRFYRSKHNGRISSHENLYWLLIRVQNASLILKPYVLINEVLKIANIRSKLWFLISVFMSLPSPPSKYSVRKYFAKSLLTGRPKWKLIF